jgi:ferric-dicitrate binding protein FerR (iron transport regulator)
MENNADIWQLVARVLNGEASATEQQELMAILRQDEALAQQYDLLNRIWKEQDENTDFQDREAAQSIISRIITKAEFEDSALSIEVTRRKSRLKRRRTWMAIASIMVVAVTGWVLLKNGSNANNSSPKNEIARESEAIEAKKGSRTSSRLPDGTTVWLNAGSK